MYPIVQIKQNLFCFAYGNLLWTKEIRPFVTLLINSHLNSKMLGSNRNLYRHQKPSWTVKDFDLDVFVDGN